MNLIGEIILLAVILWFWAEKPGGNYPVFALLLGWTLGRLLELYGEPFFQSWYYAYSRIILIILIWGWAWSHAKRRFLGWFLTTLTMAIGELFIVNEPGVLPSEHLVIYSVAFALAWLSTSSYWETVAACTGGVLSTLIFTPYFYGGLINHGELPDPFLWNFMIVCLIGLGIVKSLTLKVKAQ